MIGADKELLRIRYASHYYGDIVRRLFFAAGLIMLITLSTFKQLLPVPTLVSIFAILIVGFLAGLTNPLQKWVMVLNTGISLVGLITFEYHAVTGYDNLSDPLFWVNQGLAFIFFFALYYSTKTMRGAMLRE